MPARVDRAKLLQCLNAVQPGLSARDVVEQSASFVFRKGRVVTFNDEVSCRAVSGLPKEFLGAVPAKPLLAALEKIPDEEVEVDVAGGELLVSGKRKKVGLRLESEITLPVDAVERPENWVTLPPEFAEAVRIVQTCAGKDESQFRFTCVHLHPEWLEACDNFQMSRYGLASGVKGAALVRRDAIRHVADMGATAVAETEGWVHFKGPAVVFSCRRYVEDYPDVGRFLEFRGTPATLPRGLQEAAELAGIFSGENGEDNDVVEVDLRPGVLKVRGQGVSGWASETRKIKYDGQPLAFRISPSLLAEIAERHRDVQIGEDRLKVDGGRWTYLTVLGKAGPNGKGE